MWNCILKVSVGFGCKSKPESLFIQNCQILFNSWVFPTLFATALQDKYDPIYFNYLFSNNCKTEVENYKILFKKVECVLDGFVVSIFLLFFFLIYWGICFVFLPWFSCCRRWMWACGDVSGQRDPGFQELSRDISKLHTLWKENPSTSGKTPDLKNWRPGYWITEVWIQLPYHPEFFNAAW